ARDEAVTFLVDVLAPGPRPVEDVRREARAAGISERTLERARGKLGVRSTPARFGGPRLLSLAPERVPTPQSPPYMEDLAETGAKPAPNNHLPVSANWRRLEGVAETGSDGGPRRCPTCQGPMQHYGAVPDAGWVCPACHPAADRALQGTGP